MKNHYFETKLVKMGKWALYPLDTEAWFNEEGSSFFEKYFGIPKGILIIHDPLEHAYIPEEYFPKLHSRIKEMAAKNLKGLEKTLKKFYPLKKKIKKDLVRFSAKDYSRLSDGKLRAFYKKNRELAHHITAFDQFGWIAEEYLTSLMEEMLANKLGLYESSEEYNRVLFALAKPEEISTTLREKREVLKAVIAIQKRKTTLAKEGHKLSKAFGWMPVFAFGDSWTSGHYERELEELVRKPSEDILQEYEALKNYKKIRNAELKDIVKKYKISSRDLQVFIDFGLALDTRNEAEYCLSFAGYQVRPMYEEIAKRLNITVTDLRLMYEKEVISCLERNTHAEEVLKNKRGMIAYGYDREMKNRINFSHDEASKLFEFIENYVKNVQGGDQLKGTCASPGKATGIARIVRSPEENHKVQNGDILITHATTVDYLPSMKKAGAIITEVGGLTCHAAVVSREFRIPCVVALKNAMKNIKDGDLIEVDADKGIVRKV